MMLRISLVWLLITFAMGYAIDWDTSEWMVGGNDINITQAPYCGLLTIEEVPGRYLVTCGVTIIRPNVALTAAQCMGRYFGMQKHVLAGLTYLEDEEYQMRNITKVVIHEEFSSTTLNNDIALTFLDSDFVVDDSVQPIPLPAQGTNVAFNSTHMLIGYSEYLVDNYTSLRVSQLEMPIVEQEHCRSLYANSSLLTENMFCAGNLGVNNSGICNYHDFGVSFVSEGYLVGFTSWAVGCLYPEYPTVFVKVSLYRNWIDEKINSTMINLMY